MILNTFNYVDMTPIALISFFSGLSKSVGLHPNIIVFILLFLLLLLIASGVILLKLKSADRALNAADREMDAFVQTIEQPSHGMDSTQIHRNKSKSDPILDNIADQSKQDDVSEKTATGLVASAGLKRDVSGKMLDDQSPEKPKTSSGTPQEEVLSSLTDDSDLKEKIHGLILASGKSISLKYLVKQLYENNFDGNYHPILNELDRLEREDEIEGQVINGKVFFRTKEKTPRKFILRKGKNFRKYMG
ncbi:MAG: hypothetical protein PVH37_09715 [Desulfobacterales bacterium]